MKIFKSHFRYHKRQRNGIFFLLLIIVGLQLVFFFADFSSSKKIKITENKMAAFQNEMDSLNALALENNKPKMYAFNPNYITDYRGYQLGMNISEIDKLLEFRENGNFINSAKQFQEVTKVSDSLLNEISPFFKFPNWVTSEKNNSKSKNNSGNVLIKKNINTANIDDFKAISGVGEKIAKRIIDYRTKLQGFSLNDQLFEVWNLDKELAKKVLQEFEVSEKPSIKKMNINKIIFKELLAIVYVDFELTKKILNYRDEVAEIQSLEELKKIDGFPLEKYDRIALYLVAE